MAATDYKWEGRWDRVKGKAREHFGRLTDDEIEETAGRRQNMLGKIQEKYGETREKAEEMIKEFERKYL